MVNAFISAGQLGPVADSLAQVTRADVDMFVEVLLRRCPRGGSLVVPRAAALRGQFAELFTGRSASSLAALFAVTDSHQLAAFSRALRSLHD